MAHHLEGAGYPEPAGGSLERVRAGCGVRSLTGNESMSNQFTSLETRVVDCEFCGTETNDPFEVEDMLICGHCVLFVDMFTEFICRGGTKAVLSTRPDGQIMMALDRK